MVKVIHLKKEDSQKYSNIYYIFNIQLYMIYC